MRLLLLLCMQKGLLRSYRAAGELLPFLTPRAAKARRPPCFDFFLHQAGVGGECENGAACNYSHAQLFNATLKGIPFSGATKESVSDGDSPLVPVSLRLHLLSRCALSRSLGPTIMLCVAILRSELAAYKPAHVAFTGNPSHLNFGKGLGKVGFFSEDDLVAAVRGTLKPEAGRSVCVVLDEHKCRSCGVEMRFSPVRDGAPQIVACLPGGAVYRVPQGDRFALSPASRTLHLPHSLSCYPLYLTSSLIYL